MKSYDHKKIEHKWQKEWERTGANNTDTDLSKPKYYVLDMFPYPSGAGLHVGHPKGYIGSDVVARKKRMEGYRVLHPMGWDAFGLPAENYAIKTGKPPQQTTDESIATFKSQISNLALSYDWSREIGSHRPDYYRWTQWLFTKFFEKGLVYKKKALVNWDPVDQTVLANEQVLPDGTAERSGAVVEKKDLEQWFYKITDYADELADNLDTIDWPESTKINQRNWIGRSEGAEIDFYLDFGDEAVNARTDENGKSAHITVFTTRPDTLFGATYLVLAPEHQWVTLALDHKTVLANNDEIAAYVQASKKKADIERLAADKEKTGVELKGVAAINPATGERIPMFIADYVLAQYGTGAIMAVPAHDERDYAFAKAFDLPIRQVVMPVFGPENKRPDAVFRNTVNAVVRNDDGRLLFLKWKEYKWISNVIGGVDEGQTIEAAAVREVLEETGYRARPIYISPIAVESHYYADHKEEWRSRLDTPVLLELESDQKGPLSEDEKAKHDTCWMTYEEAQKHGLFHNNQLALDLALGKVAAYTDALHGEEQVLVNSGEYNGMSVEDAKKAITSAFGRTKKTYRLRDWLISRQRYWGAPIPIVYDPEGVPHAIPEEHLPWMLPTDVEYLPKGTSPLGSSKELKERTERIFGKGWTPEIDTMDTFACSSWYFFRFADPHNDKEFTSKDALRDWLPVDLYIGGAEHTVLHLLYARFYTKALRDMGYLNFDEPFLKLRHQGLIVAEDGRKMSKRYGNVINPDDIVEQYGADTLRVYEMFMGPFQDSIAWNTQSMIGSRRFLEKVWRLSEKITDAGEKKVESLLHRTIKKVLEDIDGFKFNTAISTLMIFVNDAEKIGVSKDQYARFLQLLAPFAPHIAEELWHETGNEGSVLAHPMPRYDDSMLEGDTLTVAIQINGKTRGDVQVATNANKDETEEAARNAVAERLGGKTITRVIVVPKKLVNFVVSE